MIPALVRDRRGVSGLLTGLMLIIVLGFAGLAIDAGGWYAARRTAQSAADSAAFSAATAVLAGDADPAAQARAVTARYGLVTGKSGVVVSVNNGPASGPYAGNAAAVEVLIRQPAKRIFSTFFTKAGTTIRARAVAVAGQTGNACVLALNGAAIGITATGGADVNLTGCSLFADSRNGAALSMSGGADLSADSVGLVGGYSLSGGARIDAANGVHTGQTPLSDPYKDVAVPRAVGCDYNRASYSNGTTASLKPGTYCNGLSISGGATVDLAPGVYVIDRGAFTVNGGATLRGTGVTIVLTSSTNSNYPTMSINGGATIKLSAPTTGPTAGLLFFQDRAAPTGQSSTFNGGANLSLQGTLYFPTQHLDYSGGSSTGSRCIQIVADQVKFTGGTNLQLDCDGTGVRTAGGRATTLVE